MNPLVYLFYVIAAVVLAVGVRAVVRNLRAATVERVEKAVSQ